MYYNIQISIFAILCLYSVLVRNWSHIATIMFLLFVLLLGQPLQESVRLQSLRLVKSDWDEI